MRSVEASAETREIAIQNALQELGIEMHEVDRIEVLDEGSKGLFGFGARPVRVRVQTEVQARSAARVGRAEREEPRGGRGPAREGREAREPREGRRDAVSTRGEGRSRRGESDGGPYDTTPEQGSRERGRGENGEHRGGRERGARGGRGGRGGQGRPRGERGGAGAREAREFGGHSPRRERSGAGERVDDGSEGEAMPAEQEMNAAPVAAAAEQETFAPISDEQGREAAVILQEMILKMGIVANVEFNRTEDGAARLSVSSEDGGILIGRKGNTLSAMQYLINRIISNRDANETTERIVVDVEGYLDRRRESLEELARSLADRAKATGRSMRLKPMSPQERRIVHLALQGDEEVRTFSLGDSLFRSVVIAPAHERAEAAPARRDRPQGNFQRRGGRGGRRRIPRGGRPSRRDSDFDAGAVSD